MSFGDPQAGDPTASLGCSKCTTRPPSMTNSILEDSDSACSIPQYRVAADPAAFPGSCQMRGAPGTSLGTSLLSVYSSVGMSGSVSAGGMHSVPSGASRASDKAIPIGTYKQELMMESRQRAQLTRGAFGVRCCSLLSFLHSGLLWE